MRAIRFLCAPLVLLHGTLAGSAQQTTAAGDACADVPAILAFADRLLVEPTGHPRFWRDHTGADAAYLKIAYGDLDRTDAAALIAALSAREKPPERIEELRLAQRSTDERLAELQALATADDDNSLPALGDSVLRALVVNDGGDWLFTELARWQASDPDDFGSSRIAIRIARSLADLDDHKLRVVGERAEAAGLPTVAFAIYSQQRVLTAVVEMLERQPVSALGFGSDANGTGAADVLRQVATQSAFRDGFDLSAQPAAVRAAVAGRHFDDAYRPLAALAVRVPQAGLLLPLFNATGETKIGTVVAAETLAELDAGTLDSVSSPDAVVARIVYGLDRVIGRALRERQLAGIQVDRTMGGNGQTGTVFVDTALARTALAASLRYPALTLPAKPTAMTEAGNWQRWVRTARSIKAHENIPADDRAMAADLLALAGRPLEAIALLKETTDASAADVAYRHMVQLDDACDDVLHNPWAMNPPIYRFPAR